MTGSSEPTDPDRAKRLLELAQQHVAHTPPPSGAQGMQAVAGEVPHAPTEAPAPPGAASAEAGGLVESAVERQVPPASSPDAPGADGGAGYKPQAFQFAASELVQALDRAAGSEGKRASTDVPVDNLADFYKSGEALGISRKTLEAALQHVALERMGQKEPALVAPLTCELQPIQPSRTRLLVIGGGLLLGLVAMVGALIHFSEPDPTAAPATRVAETAKPRRKPGQLDPKLITQAIAAVGDRSRTCHEAARKRQPKLAGKLVFDVELEEDGAFSKLDVKEDTVKDPAMVECVKNQVRAHAWPRPTGGFVAMEFPLQFQVAEETKEKAAAKPRKGGKSQGRSR